MHLGTMKLHPEVSVSICFDLPAWPARDRHGGKIGPQNSPTWVPKRSWRLAVLRGVPVVGRGQRHFFVVPRCTRAL